jgi:hypothetical protein
MAELAKYESIHENWVRSSLIDVIAILFFYCSHKKIHNQTIFFNMICPSNNLQKLIEWIATLDYNKVFIEMDCKIVVEDVKRNKPNRLEYGSIINKCRTFSVKF